MSKYTQTIYKIECLKCSESDSLRHQNKHLAEKEFNKCWKLTQKGWLCRTCSFIEYLGFDPRNNDQALIVDKNTDLQTLYTPVSFHSSERYVRLSYEPIEGVYESRIIKLSGRQLDEFVKKVEVL